MDLEYKGDYQLKLEKLKKLSLEPKAAFNKIFCPSCATEVPATNLNINDKIAKCGACNVVFSFQETVNNLFTNPSKVKQEIIRPEGIDLFYFKEELDITIQQPYSGLEFLMAFCGLLFGFLFTMIAIKKGGSFPPMAAIFFWLMTAYPIYSWSRHAKNKIYININERLLNIEWRPKKGTKDQSYNLQDIDQLYIRKNANSGLFDVQMIVNGIEGQKHIRLIPSLDNLSKARYLEQEIEKHLGIIDREVLEEIKA